MKTLFLKEMCIPIFTTALSIIAKTWKQSKCPSTDEWIKKMEYHILQYSVQLSLVQSLSRVRPLWPHEPQYARPPCPSPTPRVHPNSCASSQWCHPAISSSAIPFSSFPQSLPASGSFPMSQHCMRWPKYWSFSFSISPSNEYSGLISFRMD